MGRGGRGQEGCREEVRPELESTGAGLEETHRVSEESGKGQAGPGWCWPARSLAAALLPPGSIPVGPQVPRMWTGRDLSQPGPATNLGQAHAGEKGVLPTHMPV